ncbi:MAG: metalloregulator ArsR/SmtB family transcription factor [Rhodovibrionaceae bacterium]
MEENKAIAALGALAQETRLKIYRLLVRAGPLGEPAGGIAATLGLAPATLSFHLKELERAGLVLSRREGRRIFYAPDFPVMTGLLDFLMEDCCQGRSEVCRPLGRIAKTKEKAQ